MAYCFQAKINFKKTQIKFKTWNLKANSKKQWKQILNTNIVICKKYIYVYKTIIRKQAINCDKLFELKQ